MATGSQENIAKGELGKGTRRAFRPGFAEDVYGTASNSRRQNVGPEAMNSREQNAPANSFLYMAQQFLTAEMCASALAARRSAQLPKLKELYGGISAQTGGAVDPTPAIYGVSEVFDFNWDDCDTHSMELAELYAYSELDEFAMNFEAYSRYCKEKKVGGCWSSLAEKEKARLLQDLAQRFESAESDVRLNAARLTLYILQGACGDFAGTEDCGVFGAEEQSSERELSIGSGIPDLTTNLSDRGTGGHEEDCMVAAAAYAYTFFEAGFYQVLCAMLLMESCETFDLNLCADHRSHSSHHSSVSNSRSASNVDLAADSSFERRTKKSATLADNESLRVVINCLYHMCESIRRVELIQKIHHKYPAEWPIAKLESLQNSFIQELNDPLEGGRPPLAIFLFNMMPAFVRGKSPHYPIKKILLLTWKVLLATLGDSKFLAAEKARKRDEMKLPPVEDTLSVATKFKPIACGAPMTEADGMLPNSSASRLGKKLRSTHPTRPFSRQVACSSTWANEGGDGTASAIDGTSPAEDMGEDTQEGIIGEEDGDDEVMETPKEQAERVARLGFGASSEGSITPKVPKAHISKVSVECRKYREKHQETIIKLTENDTQLAEEDKKPPSNYKGSQKNETAPAHGNLRGLDERVEGNDNAGDQTPKAGSPVPVESLPWKSKVREADLEAFLQGQREKFFRYRLPGDSTTMFGLPGPVELSVQAFRRNIYRSLGELQIKSDEIYNKYSFSQIEKVKETRTESLYRQMLPNMTEYVIALLKVILASLPSSKIAKTDAVSILSDVLTPETDTNEMLTSSMSLDISTHNALEETVRFVIDVHRHKELIVKAASSIIIILLKTFRLNHVYQFENLAQYLILANCLPLILKFLDQNIVKYFQSKHELSPLNYPQAILYYVRNGSEWPTLNADNVEKNEDCESPTYFLWRNIFSSINLVRILNKLTKWKHARTMMLVVFKSAPVLRRCMRAQVGIFQLYVLKLLKMQARYLGRIWRRSNMDIIAAIYLRVRHRLNDDWAYANETRTKSFDFQMEEGELGTAIKRFNSRRYHQILGHMAWPFQGKSLIDDMNMEELEPVDNSLSSVLRWQPKLSDRFRRNYSKWVDEEVVNTQCNWDLFLGRTSTIIGQ